MVGEYWFYLVMFMLQVVCIYIYSAWFIKMSLKYMMYSLATDKYKQWEFSLTVASVTFTLGVVLFLYYSKVRVDYTTVPQIWVVVLALYFQIKMIVREWKKRMYS